MLSVVHQDPSFGDHFSFSNQIKAISYHPSPWSPKEIHGSSDYFDHQLGSSFRGMVEDNHSSDFMSSPPWSHNIPGLRTNPTDDTDHYYYDGNTHQREMSSNGVQDMRGSLYELSLRDLVELPRIAKSIRENEISGKNEGFMIESRSSSWEKKKNTTYSRSKSMGNGSAFLLKVFFPASLSGRKKSLRRASETYSMLQPKNMAIDGARGSGEEPNHDEDLKDELSVNGISRSMSRCYSFFQMNRSKSRHV